MVRQNKKASNSSSKVDPSKKTILDSLFPYLAWLTTNLYVGRESITPLLQYGNKLLTILKTRGKSQVIKYNKEVRLAMLKYILSLDESFETMGNPEVKRVLRPLVRVLHSEEDYPIIRLILSTLYITRGLRLKAEPSFSTIEMKPSKEASFFNTYEKDMFYFLKNKLNINPRHMGRPSRNLRWKKFHMTSKSGPTGHALWTSFRDLWNLPTPLAKAIYALGGKELESRMHKFRLLYTKIPQFFESLAPRKGIQDFRKLSALSDKEGKTREVAIGDYFSQASLRPLHKYLYKLLSRIDQDCTHNQSKHIGLITPTDGSSFHSIDLSSATDRFPIQIEWLLLKVLFGEKYASAWKFVMVYYPFNYKGRKLYYRTGNPMGMYSSWATFAVCHHFLVYLACKQARVKWETCPYMLLGDDIVIADDAVAKAYKEILLLWDIPFSPEKTHTSPHGYEFAKQIVLHGMNVSPFPLAALYDRRNSPLEAVGIILSELWSKDWTVDIDLFLETYYLKVQRWPRKRFQSFRPKLKLVTSLLQYFHGLSNLGKPIMDYVEEWTKVKDWELSSVKQRAYAHWIAVKVVHRLFTESRDRVTDYSNKLPLGELATQMVIWITSLETEVDPFEFISSVPFLQIYGRAEEVYLKLLGDLNDKGLSSGATHLRNFIGKVDIPLSDRDFYVRHRDVVLIRALRSARIMEELIKTTPQVVSWTGRLDFTLPWYEHCSYQGDLIPDRRSFSRES